MGRFARGLGALVVLAAVVVGVPWLLIMMVGNPLPSGFDLRTLWHALTRPDDGTILIRIVAVIAWVAWFVFALSVVTESIAGLSRQRIRIRLPGLAGPQKLAGGLVLLVLAMFVAPQQFAAADPAGTGHHGGATATTTVTPGQTAPDRTTPDRTTPDRTTPDRTDPGRAADDTADVQRTGGQRAGRTATVVHTVQPGDDLWTLSEHYYGKGQDWRRIAAANPALLTGGPDRLEPGWRLRIPDVDPQQRRVVVRAGDTLSGIAEREYGDAGAWHRIYQANLPVLSDPDLLPLGTSLVIPVDSEPHTSGDAQSAPHTSRTDDGTGGAEDSARTADSSRGTDRAGGEDTKDAGRTADQDRPAAGSVAPTAPESAAPTAPASAAPTAPESAAPSGLPGSGAGDDGAGDGATARPSDGSEFASHATRLAGVGGVLAATVLGGLATRRQLQLRGRAVGRRIPQPARAAQQLEAELGRLQTPAGLDLVNLALRAIGRDCHRQRRPLPRLEAARAGDDQLVLVMAQADLPAPVGFVVRGTEWRLDPADAAYLAQDDSVLDAAQPYPGLASLGTAPDGSVVLVNLEAAGLLAVTGSTSGTGEPIGSGLLTSLAAEMAFSPWSDELVITVVGDDHGLAESIDRYNVSTAPGLDQLLDRWEQRARVQRDHLLGDPGAAAGDYRIDPDLADPWVPEVGLIFSAPDSWQAERLERLLLSDPPVTIAAVVPGTDLMTDWRLTAADGRAELAPLGWSLEPQVISEPVGELITDLIATTGSQDTEPAPWWAADFGDDDHPPARALAGPPSDDQPDVVAAEELSSSGSASAGGQLDATDNWPSIAVRTADEPIEELVARSDAAWAWLAAADRPGASKESAAVPNPFADPVPQAPRHPTIMLLGPADLLGTSGERPSRAVMQCIEYCTWLLEHPSSTAQAMSAALAVAEGTRRSNVSRLRNWLGSDDQGQPYLPDAYSGRISLSPLVSSDWHRLQLLTHAGVNRTSTEALARALDLVRGAPLADAAPGQWHWAEEMRTDMVSVIRDIGVELSDRARAQSDIDLARWAASRALTAAPQDEFLMGARIRTEHQAGNQAEVERLALQLAAQGRALAVDLHPDSVDLLQQVMEGRLRARA